MLINSVPVGVSSDRGPWTLEECHRVLIAHDTSYAALKLSYAKTQLGPHTVLPQT